MMMFVRLPSPRPIPGMFSSSDAASTAPDSSRRMPPSVRTLSALSLANPPLTSFVEPLRRMIRSSGSPETVMLCCRPSTRLKTRHDDQTIMPVPRTVSAVVTQRTRRLRVLYLIGIMGSDHLPQALDDRQPRREDRGYDPAQQA